MITFTSDAFLKHKHLIHVFKNMYQVALEENSEKNQVQLGKLEATIKSLSAELLKVCFLQ